MDAFAAYGHAIVSIAAMAIFGLILGPIAAVRKSAKGLPPGSAPAPDYADPIYRFNRAHLNITEMMGFFVGATVAAILAGASPFWVNLLAALYLVSRLVVAAVHIAGIGKPDTGVRSILYTVGWACCIALAGMAIWAVF